jgi:hypothetical protein
MSPVVTNIWLGLGASGGEGDNNGEYNFMAWPSLAKFPLWFR